MKEVTLLRFMLPLQEQLTSSDWSLWAVQRPRLLASIRIPLENFLTLKLFEWWAKVAVRTASQFVFFLCSILLPLLPHSCSWEYILLSLLHARLSVLESLFSGCRGRKKTSPFSHTTVWYILVHVPDVELPRDPWGTHVNNSPPLKNRWLFCWCHQNDPSFLRKFQASPNFSIFSVHTVWFTLD